jgi:small subunit ribosomal protein S1
MDEAWWEALLADEEKSWALVPKEAGSAVESKGKSRSAHIDWGRVQEVYARDDLVELLVAGFNRGGLLVEGDSIQGFVPLSHLVDLPGEKSEDDREQLLSDYVGKTIPLKVIECDPERGRVVFSQRAALTEPGSRNRVLDRLHESARIWGCVTNITDFGVFVDLGGLEGLIHVSELSWGRVRHPSDSLSLGDQVEVYVINVDEERSRVALSLKRLHPNPWDTAAERYYPGQVTDAVVTSILPFGAFARLEEGLDGLIHVSELGPPGIRPADILCEGQQVRVRVLQVDAAQQRLGLSLRVDQEEEGTIPE